MKKISITTPCFNEAGNIKLLAEAIANVAAKEKGYVFEHIFIDNASTDTTIAEIQSMIDVFPHIGLVINNRNFGHIRSPFHGLVTSDADATIQLCSDLQEPPELIHDFLRKWEEGALVVGGVKETSKESKIIFFIRTIYYKLLAKITEHQTIAHFTGFGLYDRKVIEEFKKINDLYPYTRSLISDLGFDIEEVKYQQGKREFGVTKNNLFTLFDMAIVGMVSNSKVPIRVATLFGFFFSFLSFISGIIYLILKLLFWDSFEFGLAPLLIILSFGLSIIVFFLGIIGEYIGSMHAEILKRPRVLEKQRINYPVARLLNKEQ